MSSGLEPNEDVATKTPEGRSRLRAIWVLDRWRKQGFDLLMCYPSGYCSPANSAIQATELPSGYSLMAIDSSEAAQALEVSIEAGMSYWL